MKQSIFAAFILLSLTLFSQDSDNPALHDQLAGIGEVGLSEGIGESAGVEGIGANGRLCGIGETGFVEGIGEAPLT